MRRPWNVVSGLVTAAVLAVVFSVFGQTPAASAVNPATMSFQGKVVNADGTNVTDGNYSFLFKLYTVSSAGTAVWTETQTNIPVMSGTFQVNLGSSCSFFVANACNNNTPVDFSASNNLYLGITFNGDAAGEMTPRVQMQSVPFAYQADNASKVGGLAVSQLVQLSPGAQQNGFINVAQASTFGNNLTVAGLINGQANTTALSLTGAPVAGSGLTSLLQLGGSIAGGNSVTNGGTYLGINTPGTGSGSAADFLNFQNNSVSKMRITSAGAVTQAGNLTIQSGGANITGQTSVTGGNILVQQTGVGAALTVDRTDGVIGLLKAGGPGAKVGFFFDSTGSFAITADSRTNISAGSAGTGTDVLTALANGNVGIGDTTPTATLSVGSGDLFQVAGATGNLTTVGSITTTAAGGSALVVSGYPAASATASLVQMGDVIAGGNAAVNGGTFLGINTPTTGAGSAADYMDFENGGLSKFKVTNSGSVSFDGSFTGSVVNDTRTAETAAATYTETKPALAYYLSSSSGTSTNTNFTTTFNITGLPATDGTVAYITGVAVKGATGLTRQHTVVIDIGGTVVATISTASGTAASTNSRSFTVARINGAWTVVGEGTIGTVTATTSTSTTADFAEWIHYSGDSQPQPGDVLTVGNEATSVKRSTNAYDKQAIGVVSTTPYQTGGVDDGHSVVIALVGRVPVKVSLENGPIALGDKLTASSTPGVAMKATKAGHILGTSLSAYDGSQTVAEATVWLAAGYDDPQANGTVLSSAAVSSGALATDNSQAVSAVALNASEELPLTSPKASSAALRTDNANNADALSVPLDMTAAFTTSLATTPTPTASTAASTPVSLADASGTSFITFDTNGNGRLNGGLSLGSATISGGLMVGGDTTFAGLTTFQKLATFVGKTIFRQDVQFDGHITVAKDSAGYANLRAGESTVHVTFKNEYPSAPVVNATLTNGKFANYAIDKVDTKGFDITVQAALTNDISFNWTAVGVNDPQTAINPLPSKP